ncbi:peptidase S10, serine carboxypeptidase [Wallemia mellicola]|uniref:Carboxypeptidase n=1 Tax=Wallemia mellicola TaxID=1708541 RepID=A0A4T0LZF8_9BASI|nr:peptidase S10, serine carboxypeptidase [Wallemia mellicola]
MINNKILLTAALAGTAIGLPSKSNGYASSLDYVDSGLSQFQSTVESIVQSIGLKWFDNNAHNSPISADELVIDDIKYKVLKHDQFPDHRIRLSEPKLCDAGVQQYSGYVDISDSRSLFFWFFESRSDPKSDPFVMWLNGGPGCSSSTGLLTELGPCSVAHGGKDTEYNTHSWNNNANLLFLDQPINVGYSYSDSDSVNTTPVAADDVYAFLQIFFKHYDDYAKLPFSIAAESYGGRYAPLIADVINNHNQIDKSVYMKQGAEDNFLHINLESILLGNGLTDPKIQFPAVYDYACHGPYKIFDPEGGECANLKSKANTCERLIDTCYKTDSRFTCLPAALYCWSGMYGGFQQLGLNPYDVRKTCDRKKDGDLCYKQMGWIETYLNQPEVKKELGVPKFVEFESCNFDVNRSFMGQGDSMHNSADPTIPNLLDSGVRVLVYAGKADFMCNYIGNKKWVEQLPHELGQEIAASNDETWIVDGNKAGAFKIAQNDKAVLQFVEIEGAGHMVPLDRGHEALALFNGWVHGNGLNSTVI